MMTLRTGIVLAIGGLFSASVALANPITGVRGVVPLEYQKERATDLVYQGKVITPQQAHILHMRDGIDLSFLDPEQATSPNTKSFWVNNIGAPVDESLDNILEVAEGDEVEFLDSVPTPISQFKGFRFTAKKKDSRGIPRVYTFLVAKRAHTFLLRKALLRKLGYEIPAMKHLKNLRVNFSSSFVRNKDFLGCVHDREECKKRQEEDEEDGRGLKNNMYSNAGHPERWVTNWQDINVKHADLQDVIVFSGDIHIYNLAVIPIDEEILLNRRVLNALLVPLNLVDVRETVNGFFWHSGRKWSKAAYLPLEDPQDFTTSYSDAKWILRKLRELDENDFKEIVAEARYPEPVALLLEQKLKARRNSLFELFDVKAEPLDFDPKVSHGKCLKKGRLVSDKCWSGYGSNFLYPEEESPISKSEIGAFFKSKALSVAIDEFMDKVNEDYMYYTKLDEVAFENQREEALKAFFESLRTGERQDIPFGVWSHPIYSTRLTAEREVIAGRFMGADNMIQLADTVGFAVDAGLYAGTHGLKKGQLLDGQAKVFFHRNYTHLKPIMSIKKALKEPLRNMIVPLIKKEFGQLLDELLDGSLDDMDKDDRVKKIRTVLGIFKEHLGDRESLIITNSFGGTAAVRAGYSWSDRVRAQATLVGSRIILNRLHIVRNGNTLHVYKDYGKTWGLQFDISLEAGVQLVNFRAKGLGGKAKVKFHTLTIDHDLAKLQDEQQGWRELIRNVQALRTVLVENSLEEFEGWKEPHILEHKISEASTNWRFLFLTGFNQKTYDDMTVTYPNKMQERFVRRTSGKRRGNDFQALTVDVANTLIEELTDEDIEVENRGGGNPGDTIFGKSFSRNASFEGEVNSEGQTDGFEEIFMSINYRWKGWEAKNKEKKSKAPKKKMCRVRRHKAVYKRPCKNQKKESNTTAFKKILMGLEDRFEYDFYDENVFHLVETIQLYTVYVKIFIYNEGVNHVAHLSQKEIVELFEKWGKYKKKAGEVFWRPVRAFFKHQQVYLKHLGRGDLKKAAIRGEKMISLLETTFPVPGLIEAVGGDENIYITSTVEGFKQGEDGGQALNPVIGHDIGLYGSERRVGPLETLRGAIGMTYSEFYIKWLLRDL